MLIDFPATEPCMRCNGKGHYFVTVGYPGQDPRLVGGFSKIKWTPTRGPFWCPVCSATGRRKQRRRPQTGPRTVDITGNTATLNYK